MSSDFPTKRIWLVAVLVGVILGPPLSFLAPNFPWIIIIPIVLGVGIVCFLEFSGSREKPERQIHLLKMPSSFFGLARYRGHVALGLPVEDDDPAQGTFDFLKIGRRRPHKGARIIRDPETGEQIYLIDAERFVTKLLNQILHNTDQVTEVSLNHALHRYGEMELHSGELERFLKDKSVLEVVKSDFRGNTAQNVNRSGEAVIRELVSKAKESSQKDLPHKPTVA